MRIKHFAYAYKILTLVGLFYIAFYRTCVYTHAYFLRSTKNKIRIWYAYFSGIYTEIFLRCDVTRLLGVVVMVLAFETFNLGSFLTKILTFIFTQM